MNEEVDKFSLLSKDWWNKSSGPFRVLHKINGLRTKYILDVIQSRCLNKNDVRILDVGCGGGILSEEVARAGYNTVGIDLSESSINQAILHSKNSNVTYLNIDISDISEKFDVIIVMEVLEHVENVESFLISCIKCLNHDGILFFSTINRTNKSFLFAIFVAEYLLKMIPKGTHNWKRFIRPSELSSILYKNRVSIKDLKGMEYSILRDEWYISNCVHVNYLGFASFYS